MEEKAARRKSAEEKDTSRTNQTGPTNPDNKK
jgi:hypothetical protein